MSTLIDQLGAKTLEDWVGKDPETKRRIRSLIDTYLAQTKGWSTGDYELIVTAESETSLEISAFHMDDLEASDPGGGKSVALIIDVMTLRIVQELGFQ